MTASDIPAPPRDEQGRWLPGGPSPNPGGRPRNPWRLALERIAGELDADSGESAVEAILRRLADEARAGDTTAAAILLDRLLPKARAGEDDDQPFDGPSWRDVFETLPPIARRLVMAAVRANAEGRDSSEAVHDALRQYLDQAQHERLTRALLGALEVATSAEDLDARLASLTDDEIEALDAITMKLRTAPILARIEERDF